MARASRTRRLSRKSMPSLWRRKALSRAPLLPHGPPSPNSTALPAFGMNSSMNLRRLNASSSVEPERPKPWQQQQRRRKWVPNSPSPTLAYWRLEASAREASRALNSVVSRRVPTSFYFRVPRQQQLLRRLRLIGAAIGRARIVAAIPVGIATLA